MKTSRLNTPKESSSLNIDNLNKWGLEGEIIDEYINVSLTSSLQEIADLDRLSQESEIELSIFNRNTFFSTTSNLLTKFTNSMQGYGDFEERYDHNDEDIDDDILRQGIIGV